MNVRDLIEQLETFAEDHGNDTQVLLAFQPNWPLQFAVGEVVATEASDVRIGDLDEDGFAATEADVVPVVIYIGDHYSNSPYVPSEGCDALGWKR